MEISGTGHESDIRLGKLACLPWDTVDTGKQNEFLDVHGISEEDSYLYTIVAVLCLEHHDAHIVDLRLSLSRHRRVYRKLFALYEAIAAGPLGRCATTAFSHSVK